MRLLFTIPHFVRPGGSADPGRNYGSLAADSNPRIHALAACLTALHQSFDAPPCFIHHGSRTAQQAKPAVPCSIDIVICTTGACHILDSLPIEPRYYMHRETDAEPMRLGFACHDVLRERLGQYDYYCYLEDDLILRDSWFFLKLGWFGRIAGPEKLLQPNRFEAGLNHLIPKIYVDGDLAPSATKIFQDVNDSGPLTAEAFGVPIQFVRTLNPHSGCFFLSAEQMDHWVRQMHFNDRDSRFIGPLETTATLGIMRTFKVYRPASANADFLEIQHDGTGYLERLRPELPGGPP